MEVSGRRKKGHIPVGTALLCDPCLVDDEQEHSKSYCVECNEFLCDNCSRAHRNSTISRGHQLLTSDKMPKRKLTSLEKRNCPKHANKQIEYYCNRHTQVCCSVCVTLDHKQCEVTFIDDLAKDYNTSKEYKDFLKQVQEIENNLLENKEKVSTNGEDANRCFDRMIEEINTFRREINSKLDEMEARLINEAKKVRSDDLATLDSINTLCENTQGDINDMKSTLDNLEKYRQNTQLVIFSKKAQISLKSYGSEMEKLTERNRIRNYSFQCNEEILRSLLSSINIGTLKYDEKEDKGRKNHGQTQSDTIQKNEDPRPVKATYLRKVNIQHKQDTDTCYIPGSVLLTNDTLALVDNWNRSVKIVDLHSDKVTSFIRLADQPRDITCMNPSTLIVTSDTKLTFLKYDRKLSIIKELPMEAGCHGITYGNNKLFVTFTKQPEVKVFDTDGNILQTFKTNSQGQNLFVCPKYITLSIDGQTMYVSDFSQNTVTSLGMDGQVYNIYKHEHLSGPQGITVDENNSVYVTGWGSRNVHQITSECRHVQIVLDGKDGLGSYPWTVSFNSNTNTMYINGSSFRCNDMFVFKME